MKLAADFSVYCLAPFKSASFSHSVLIADLIALLLKSFPQLGFHVHATGTNIFGEEEDVYGYMKRVSGYMADGERTESIWLIDWKLEYDISVPSLPPESIQSHEEMKLTPIACSSFLSKCIMQTQSHVT